MSEFEFRRRAEQCVFNARTATDKASQSEWLAMAARWGELADQAERAARKRWAASDQGQRPVPTGMAPVGTLF